MCLLWWLACPNQAQAKRKTLSGTWRASAMVERWNIGDWGAKCGPRPSAQGAPGGTATITQSGNELSIRGAGRSYSTTHCWEQSPGLRRVSHSASARGWSNRCTTAAGDPRRATVITTMSATDDAIHFDETGSYQFVLKGQNCTASVRRSRSFKLIQRAGETGPAATSSLPNTTTAPKSDTTTSPTSTQTSPPPKQPNSCENPGKPARLEVRPARKLMRPGETFSFRTLVIDRQGCRLNVAPVWRMTQGEAKVKVEPGGKVTVNEASPEGIAEFAVSVRGKSVKVSVEVASHERYESLLEARGLNEVGEADEAAVAVIATGSLGGGDAVAEDTARKRKIIFAAVVGSAALVLALVAIFFLHRGAKKQRIVEYHEVASAKPDTLQSLNPAPNTHHESSPLPSSGQQEPVYDVEHRGYASSAPRMTCPVCQQKFPPGSLFCPNEGTRLIKASGSSGDMQAAAGGICPTCKRGFPSEIKYCPEHREALVPAPLYNATASKSTVQQAPRGKICPTCGKRYEGEAEFCGKDGTSLVLVN